MTFEGIIYKITGSCGKVYIGSTTDYYTRKKGHNVNKGNTTYSKKLTKPLQFEVIRKDQYKLIKTMLLVEQYYIDIYKCVNKRRAYVNDFIRERLLIERYESNKESYQEYSRKSYQKNKESRLEKAREKYEYDEEFRDKIKLRYEENKESIQNKREQNKEDINKKARETYHLNKERLKINCPYCNLRLIKNCLKTHQKSKRCRAVQEAKSININITINL